MRTATAFQDSSRINVNLGPHIFIVNDVIAAALSLEYERTSEATLDTHDVLGTGRHVLWIGAHVFARLAGPLILYPWARFPIYQSVVDVVGLGESFSAGLSLVYSWKL